MTNAFNPLLDTYSKGTVSGIHFDMDVDQIAIDVKPHEDMAPVKVVFENVNAFYYIDHYTGVPLNQANLNTISFDHSGFGEFATVAEKNSDEFYVSIPNFAVSVNESSLYIDAKTIIIQNKAYNVK